MLTPAIEAMQPGEPRGEARKHQVVKPKRVEIFAEPTWSMVTGHC